MAEEGQRGEGEWEERGSDSETLYSAVVVER